MPGRRTRQAGNNSQQHNAKRLHAVVLKSLITILFISGLLNGLNGQIKTSQAVSPKGDLSCVYKQKFSAAKRKQFYPFNVADSIKITSFRFHKKNYPIKANFLLVDSLVELKALTQSEINKLTDVLYNNFYKQKTNYGAIANCFWPRNAILFFDKTGRLFESIIICFHCDRYTTSSDRILFGDNCEQKIDRLRKFFIASGLKFGTDKSVDQYPGENLGEEIIAPPK